MVIIIDDFGYGGEGTEEMLSLPIPITAAVMPGLSKSQLDAVKAYINGNDVILHMPMEPKNGNPSWLGPNAITEGLSEEDITNNIQLSIDELGIIVGINNHMGSKIMENKEILENIMLIVKENGLIFVDSVTTANSMAKELAEEYGVHYVKRDVFIDGTTQDDVENNIAKTVSIAKENGYAIAIGHVGPAGGMITVNGIKASISYIEKEGVTIVTLSELSKILWEDIYE